MDIRKVETDFESIAERDRFDAFYEYWKGHYSVEPADSDVPIRCENVATYQVGSVLIGKGGNANVMHRRTRKELSKSNDRFVTLRAHLRGASDAEIGGQHIRMTPDQMTLYDLDRELEALNYDIYALNVTIPHSVLEFDPGRDQAAYSIDRNSAVGRTLLLNLYELQMTVEAGLAEGIVEKAETFVDLLRGLVLDARPDERTQVARRIGTRTAAERLIRGSLTDPGLGAASLQTCLGVSRPTLYRMFENDGGVRRFIQQRRAAAARDEIMASSHRRGLIAEVAHKYCFADQAHFSRVFKAEFGYAPSDLVGTRRTPSAETSEKSPSLTARSTGPRFQEIVSTIG